MQSVGRSVIQYDGVSACQFGGASVSVCRSVGLWSFGGSVCRSVGLSVCDLCRRVSMRSIGESVCGPSEDRYAAHWDIGLLVYWFE